MACEPRAHLGVVGAERGPFQRQQRVVAVGLRPQRRILLRLGLEQGQRADVLEQAGQHQVFQALDAGVVAQQARGQRGQHAAPPDALLVAGVAAAAHSLGQREAQGQADGGVQSEQGQGLRQVVDPAPARVQRRIGHPQHPRGQRRVHADRLRRRIEVRPRVLRQFDDPQGHCRR